MAAMLVDVRRLLPDVRQELLKKPNVVATGVGYKIVSGKQTRDVSIVCSVGNKKPKAALLESELLPKSVQDVPVDVVATGPIYALQNPRGRFRPAPGGISLGHFLITAGTLGIWVRKNGKHYLLSNNHVVANSNAAALGDPILQPGPTDGGRDPEDRIATLSEFIPIQFDGDDGNGGGCRVASFFAGILNVGARIVGSQTRLKPVRIGEPQAVARAAENLVDAAIAEPGSLDVVKNEILEIGTVSETVEGTLGMSVRKMGRTTGLTNGTILQVDVTSRVNYGGNRVATFVDQLVAGNMSQGGDSGSGVVSADNKLVGLLFAGSTNSTIINRIQNVFSALNITL